MPRNVKELVEVTYRNKYQIKQQRATILKAYNHLKDPKRQISVQQLQDYLYHLGLIINLTSSPSTARNANKVAGFIRRYLEHIGGQKSKIIIR